MLRRKTRTHPSAQSCGGVFSCNPVFYPVPILLRVEQAEPLELLDKAADRGIGGVAVVLLQLLGGELAGAVSGEHIVPKRMLFLCDLSAFQDVLEGGESGRGGNTWLQLVIHLMDEIGEEGSQVYASRELCIFLNLSVGLVVTTLAPFDQRGEGDKQCRGVAVLDEVPKVQQAGHAPVAIKIRMKKCDVEVNDGRLDEIIHLRICLDKRNQGLHVLGEFFVWKSGMLHVLSHDIDGVVAVSVALQQPIVAVQVVSDSSLIEAMNVLLRDGVGGIGNKIQSQLHAVDAALLIGLGSVAL